MAAVPEFSHEDGFLSVCMYLRDIGLSDSPAASWDDYPALTPFVRGMLNSIMTPAAYKALYLHPSTFEKVYTLTSMRFSELTILKGSGERFEALESRESRLCYAEIFEFAQLTILENCARAQRDRQQGVEPDIQELCNMAISFLGCMEECCGVERMVIKGCFPYFTSCELSIGETVFFYFHSQLNRIVLIASSFDERGCAVRHILATGLLHTFERLCAWCGRAAESGAIAADLRKCPCKKVRYCDAECQTSHWPAHKAECRAARRAAAGPS